MTKIEKSCKNCFYHYFKEWGLCQFTCCNHSHFIPIKPIDDNSIITCPICKIDDERIGEVIIKKPKIYEFLDKKICKYDYICSKCEHTWNKSD